MNSSHTDRPRIQKFSSRGGGGGGGGGGGHVNLTKKKMIALFVCFCFLLFLSPRLILQKSNG